MYWKEKKEAILWVDVETSGTSPETDYLLEVGAVISNMDGSILGPTFTRMTNIGRISDIIATSSKEVREIHDKSGLWKDMWSEKTYSPNEVDDAMSDWLKNLVDPETILYFGGNSITLDRNFLHYNLPKTYEKISYRSIDVTSLSLSIQSNTSINGFKKSNQHRALPDAIDSMEEYRYYVSHLKNLDADVWL